MKQTTVRRQSLSRRTLLAGTASAAVLGPGIARAQQNANLGTPATVISSPPRDFAHGHPSICANLYFGGPKRDRLFMAASQSLYMLQVATQGAAPG